MRIADAPKTSRGYYEARPGDIAGLDGLVIVDVRPEDELTGELGHIHGVRHVPTDTVTEQGLADVSPDDAVVLVCRNGRESAACAASLVERGYGEVYVLVGGMVRWNAEERPVARAATWR